MNIYIAYTGGTIGMVPSENGLIPDAAFADHLLSHLNQTPSPHQYEIYSYPDLIDSSNATPSDWQTLAYDLKERWSKFDAFIILHGTDTMAYSAAALSYMFQHADKPVILTGSQVPMFEARTDAVNNILGAVSACEQGPNGVFLFFADRLIDGARAHKSHTSDWQAFSSPNYPERGVLGIDWQWRPPHTPKTTMTVSIPEMVAGKVTLLPVFPGVKTEHWLGLLNDEVKGAVLLSYGAGNAPDRDPDLLDVLAKATERGVVIVNVSQCGSGRISVGAYAAGSALVKAGVISGSDMTYEAAFAKLHFLIGKGLTGEALAHGFLNEG